ncbi:MAG: glycosyltransferase family 9 protein [Minisyncoccia bacterium]
METILLLGRCFARALLVGRANKKPVNVLRVAVVQTAKMGDMVCTTPMFRAIKNMFPQAEVFVVGDATNEEVVRYNPDVSGYVVWKNDVRLLAKELAKLHIDFACLTTPNFKALSALYLSGIPSIVAPKVHGGWSPLETKSYKLIRTLVLSASHTMGQYAPREYLRLLEPLGIHSEDTTKHLAYSPEAKEEVVTFLTEHGLIKRRFAIISPSAGNKVKKWPAERFARVAEYLVSKSMPVVVIGSSRDREEVDEMFAELSSPHSLVVNGVNLFSIDALKALISQAALFVSVDTGPLYIAEAFGVATVDITGPIDEREQPPIGSRNLVVVPKHRTGPELFVLNARRYSEEEAIRQTESITIEDVITAIDSLL